MASEALLGVLRHVTGVVAPLEVPVALAGGLALAVWGYPRATRDVDLVLGVDAGRFDDILAELVNSGCQPKNEPPLITVGEYHIAQFLYTPPDEFYDVQFDLLLAESDLLRTALQRAVERDVPGLESRLKVLTSEDLILLKLLAGRVIDQSDVVMLLRENDDVLDHSYLEEWLDQLELRNEYRSARQIAFPGA